MGAKAALVTGANTGLQHCRWIQSGNGLVCDYFRSSLSVPLFDTGMGFETAKELASLGYSVVLACRDVTKGQKARDAIKYAC